MARIDTRQKLQFLESTTNLKGPVQHLSKRVPNAGLLAEISTCLLHGRLFSENASKSPLEIRPLLRHYSFLNFAKALILCVRGIRLSALPQSHGLTFRLAEDQSIAGSSVKISGKGTFQMLNDVLAGLNRFRYIDADTFNREVVVPTSLSDALRGLNIRVQEVWRHTPYVGEIYSLTFQEPHACVLISHYPQTDNEWDLRFDLPDLFSGRVGLQEVVGTLRARFPFLAKWRVKSAVHAWNNSVVTLTNANPGLDEFDEAILHEQNGRFDALSTAQGTWTYFDPVASLPPLAGGFSAHPYYASPIGGHYVSEYSIGLIGLHALSSIVRYSPHLWTAAIHGRACPSGGRDDHLMAMIEAFLKAPAADLSYLVTSVLMGDE